MQWFSCTLAHNGGNIWAPTHSDEHFALWGGGTEGQLHCRKSNSEGLTLVLTREEGGIWSEDRENKKSLQGLGHEQMSQEEAR